MRLLLAVMMGMLLISTPVMAAEVKNVEVVESEVADETVSESDPVVEYSVEFPESIGTYAVNEDDYNFSEVSTYAVTGDVYAGSYNSTILSLWSGLLSNNVGKDYVGYRSSQYEYYIFFGEDFVYSGGTFSGSGSYYYLNTYGNGYGYQHGTDSFSVSVPSGYLYTNVSPDFPSLDNDRGLIYEQLQTVLLIALLAFYVLRWIFIRQ